MALGTKETDNITILHKYKQTDFLVGSLFRGQTGFRLKRKIILLSER